MAAIMVPVTRLVICLLHLSMLASGQLLLQDMNSTTRTQANESRGTNSSDPRHFFQEHQDCSSMFECPPPLETKSKVLPVWDKLGCRCDDACTTYGDCCSNWATYDPRETRKSRHRFHCVNFVTYQGIYLLSSCPDHWDDNEVRRHCELAHIGDGNTRDPVGSTPVTSLNTRFTYPNYYCAVCNNDTDRSVYWTPRVECEALHVYNVTYGNITEEYVWKNLQFNESSSMWGVHLPQNSKVDFRPFIQNTSFVPCSVVLEMPTNVVDLIRQCYPWVDVCPAEWTNVTVKDLCQSYTAVVFNNFADMPIFRNIHCAICNGQSFKDLDCRSFPLYRNVVPSSFAPPSFAFLFDINEDDGNVVGTVRRCPLGEVYDPFFRYCRQMTCLNSSFTLRQGRCALKESTSSTPDVPTTTSNTTTTDLQGSTTDSGLTNCPIFNISQADYEMYSNGSVYIYHYERIFPPGEYVTSSEGTIVVCSPLSRNESEDYLYKRKFSLFLAYITLAGLGISITCIFFHMLAFLLVPSLRNLSGKNLLSLCMALVVAYATFIVSQFNGAVSKPACTSVGVILYYCFLATFFWMNAIAFDVWRTLRLATSELRVSAGQQWRKFVVYSTYSWIGPAIIVATAVVVENSPSVPHTLRPSFGKFTCWFGSRRALLLFFVVPVIVVLLINVVLFLLSARIIIGSTHTSAKLHPSCNARRNFSLYLRLALIMGLSWVFGIAAGQLDTQPLWYVFVILNTLQGLFIFLSFTCTKKVRTYLMDKVFCPASMYYTSTQGTGSRSTRKHELEGCDSGSGESQSSQTSRTTLTNVSSSQLSHNGTDPLY